MHVPRLPEQSQTKSIVQGSSSEVKEVSENSENLNIQNSDEPNPVDLDGQVYPEAPQAPKQIHYEHTYTRAEGKPFPKYAKRQKTTNIEIEPAPAHESDSVQIDSQLRIEELDALIQGSIVGQGTIMLSDSDDDDIIPLNYDDIKNKPNSDKWYQAVTDEPSFET